jgi:hypothetical protein
LQRFQRAKDRVLRRMSLRAARISHLCRLQAREPTKAFGWAAECSIGERKSVKPTELRAKPLEVGFSAFRQLLKLAVLFGE